MPNLQIDPKQLEVVRLVLKDLAGIENAAERSTAIINSVGHIFKDLPEKNKIVEAVLANTDELLKHTDDAVAPLFGHKLEMAIEKATGANVVYKAFDAGSDAAKGVSGLADAVRERGIKGLFSGEAGVTARETKEAAAKAKQLEKEAADAAKGPVAKAWAAAPRPIKWAAGAVGLAGSALLGYIGLRGTYEAKGVVDEKVFGDKPAEEAAAPVDPAQAAAAEAAAQQKAIDDIKNAYVEKIRQQGQGAPINFQQATEGENVAPAPGTPQAQQPQRGNTGQTPTP